MPTPSRRDASSRAGAPELPAEDLTERPLAELVSLAGRVAVVTGAARGIGLAVARRLAEAGARVVVADLDERAAGAAAATIPGAVGAAVDVVSEESVSALADRAELELGRLDVWVNNAGVYPSHELLAMTEDEWRHVLDTNLTGAFLGAREAGRRLVAAGRGGAIVNIASTGSFRAAGAGASHYIAAKHGVLGLTKSLAVELGPYGIRVLAIAPAVTATPGLDEARAALAGGGFELDELGAKLPLGRIAVPDDVARVALFCASDLSSLMTGSTLAVDAGYLAT